MGSVLRTCAAAVLVAALALVAPGSSAATSGDEPHVTRTTLPNGLRVAIIEDHALPLAQVALWYGVGSAADPPGRSGTAHALEHMMFRGTRALSGAALTDLEARLGADTNADTDYEYTHFYQTVPSDTVAAALHIEADRMRGLRLRQADWNLERGAVLTELAGYATSDVSALEDAVRAAAYRGTAFEHDQAGTPHDVARITASDLRRVYETGYAPDDALLAITGDVDPVRTLQVVRALFGPIRGRAHDVRPRSEPLAARGFVVRRRARSVRLVDLALEEHGTESRDALAEELAVELLQPTHGVLRDALVGHGPCVSYAIDDDSQRFGGLVHVVCALDRDADADAALRTMRTTFARLARSVPHGTLAAVRRADRANTDYARDALADEADLWGETLATLHVTPPEEDRRIAAMPDAAVVAVLRRWATPAGAGIAAGRIAAVTMGVEPVRSARAEHVPAPSRLEPLTLPRWARIAPLPEPSLPPVDAFSLPNGLRLFVARRPGSDTAYVRGRNGGVPYFCERMTNASLRSRAERRAIVFDIGMDADAHGYARDLPDMIAIVRDACRVPQHGVRAGAWIAVTGDVDSAAVYAAVVRAFGADRPSPAATPSGAAAARWTPPPHVTISFGPASPRAAAGFILQPVPRREQPDFAAMSLVNAILGGRGDFDTRLMREVRERRGLVYGTASFYDADRGWLGLYFDASSAKFATARAAVRDVLQQLRAGPIGADELERARRKLIAAALRTQASPDGILGLLQRAAVEDRAPDDVATLAALYRAVSVQDAERVARTWLRLDRMTEIDEGVAPRGHRIPLPF